MHKFKIYVFAILLVSGLFLGGCSGCEDTLSDENEAGDVGIGDDVDDGDDAGQSDDTGGGGDDAGDNDGDSNDGDNDGDANDGDDDMCPSTYQQECGGECVATNVDIEHCGGCGIECQGPEACVGGECTTECMGDLQLCDNRCVDYSIDNDHCGSCGSPCPDGFGCSEGGCVEAADLGPAPDFCDGGGPAIDVDTGSTQGEECAGNIAQSTFLWAVCTCNDLMTEDQFLTDGFNSTGGAYKPGGLGGGVGVNGNFATESEAWIWGAVHVGEPSTLNIGDHTEIHQQLHVGGDFNTGDQCDVYDDTHISGNIDASGGVDITGDLYHDPASTRAGTITYDNLIEQPVTVDPPCDCSDDGRVPIDDIVTAAQSPNNDNSLIGLDQDLLIGSGTPERIDLPCGNYYLSEIDVSGNVTIVAEGRVGLYIDGDINLNGELTMTPGPLGELDIFVTGNVETDGLTLGSPNYPASTRLYIGGDQGMTLGSETQIGGNIYAVPGTLYIQDQIDVFGALYAEDMLFESELSVHYDRQVARSGQSCPVPDDDDDDDDGGDDNDDDGGGDDNDDEPQCLLESDACSDDSDCCAPLVCDNITETCSLMQCQPTGETCVYNDQCCSGTCAILSGDDEGQCIDM